MGCYSGFSTFKVSVFDNKSDDYMNVQTYTTYILDNIWLYLRYVIYMNKYYGLCLSSAPQAPTPFNPLIRNMWNLVWSWKQICFDVGNQSAGDKI